MGIVSFIGLVLSSAAAALSELTQIYPAATKYAVIAGVISAFIATITERIQGGASVKK